MTVYQRPFSALFKCPNCPAPRKYFFAPLDSPVHEWFDGCECGLTKPEKFGTQEKQEIKE